MTPYETVLQHATLPFKLYPFQQDVVNELATLPRAGYWADPGVGKTAMSTASAIYKHMVEGVDHTLVIMPPILIDNWARWLGRIPEIDLTIYRGTPAERKKIKLAGDFILMSMQIFKLDYDRIMGELGAKNLVFLVDEATSVKSISSANHKKINEACAGHHLMLLSGTPLSTPLDGYAYCKLKSPGLYRNMRQFENVHVAERDFFDKPTKWANLELLAENMKVNSVRILKEDVLKDLPPVTYTPLFYSLAPAHAALYKKLANEQLLQLEGGGKIDATTAQNLFHALQQIVLNYGYFSEDESNVAAGIDLLDEIMDELGDKKLVVFTNYRMTNELLKAHTAAKYNGRVLYGGMGHKQQQASLDTFVDDPNCRVLTLQIQAGGMGIDNLQSVCSDVLFLEFPTVPAHVYQALSRIHRDGQKEKVNVRIAIAEKTLQVRKFETLMDNDQLVNRVIRNIADLRAAIFGN